MASLRISALFLIMVFITGLLTGLTACGKTGALYLPDEPVQAKNSQQPTNPKLTNSEPN